MKDFQNPNNQDTTGRMLLAFALTFVVILVTQQFMAKYYKKPEPQSGAPAAVQTPPPVDATGPAPAPAAQRSPATPRGSKQGSSESEVVVENEFYRLTFTNKGAQVKSWILKKYTDDLGKPLELVNTIAAPQYGYPLSLYTYNKDLGSKLNSALFVQEGGTKTAATMQAPAVLTFEYNEGGIAAYKKFSFYPHSYEVAVETSVTQGGSQVAAYPMWPAGFGDQTIPASYATARVDVERSDKIERIAYKKVTGGATIAGPFLWAGTMDQYFATVFLPDDPNSTSLVSLHNTIDIPKNLDKPDPNEHDNVSVLGAAVGNPNGTTRERVFVGPKALDVLATVHPNQAPGAPSGRNLEGLVDFGMFSIVSRSLFLWLKWTYEHWIHNYGWAILILTVIINVALLPLRISGMKSALKMQKIQPQLKAINDKYRQYKLTDPRQADKNREIQELHKREGVNPIGGCFPTLLQLPFLWAFYTMLGIAIELRHAPWLWLHDLAGPDPHHLLNILFIASMFAMQTMTPQGGMDPAQQKVMQVAMPIMLGVFTWKLSAGLVLYWAAGNLIGIVQQQMFNRTSFGREMRVVMQKRAQKTR